MASDEYEDVVVSPIPKASRKLVCIDPDELERMRAIVDRLSSAWGTINRERGRLIDLQIAQQITDDDRDRLVALHELADAYLDHVAESNQAKGCT